jgi:hypothetical protein
VAKPKVNGYWRTEYGLIEDRTDKGLGYANLWTTDDLARARDHAELLLLDGKKIEVKTRQVFYTDWASLPESATPPSSEENQP